MTSNLKPYPQYEDSGLPWLGEYPAHWSQRRMKFLFDERVQKGFAHEPLLAATQTKGVVRKTDYGERTVTAQKDLHLLKLVDKGDFVISLRSFQGGIEVAHYRGIISPAYTVLRPRKEARNSYFSYFFKSAAFINSLTLFVTGIREGQNIDYVRMSRSHMPLPLQEEQDLIARFLSYANRRVERAIRAKKKLIALLNEQKQAIIHRAVTRGLDPDVTLKPSGIPWLGDIPHNWSVKRLKFVVDDYGPGIQMGPFGSSLTDLQSSDTGFKLFGQENTISGDFTRGRRWVTKRQFEQLSKYELIAGDIALTRKGSIGKARLIPQTIPHGIADSDTIRVRLDSRRVNPSFIVTVLHSAVYVQSQLIATQRGAVLRGLNTATIRNLKLILPPQAEQSAVLNSLLEETRKFVQAVTHVEREIELLFEYRTRLVADIVMGKLDVRDVAACLPEEASPEPDALTDAEESDESELLEEDSIE